MTLSLSPSSHPNLPSPTTPDTPALFFHYPQPPCSLHNPIFFPISFRASSSYQVSPTGSSPPSPSPSLPINTFLSHHPHSSLPAPTAAGELLLGPSPKTPALGRGVSSPYKFLCPSAHPGLPARPGRGGAAGPRAACSLEPVARQPTTPSPTR